MVTTARADGRSAIAISSSDRELVFVNDAYAAMLGFTTAQLVGRKWSDLMLPPSYKAVIRPFEKFLKDHKPYCVDADVLRHDGSVLRFTAQSSALSGGGSSGELLVSEMHPHDNDGGPGRDAEFRCAEIVRDLTYELAALTGRKRMHRLTEALLMASASAEEAIDVLEGLRRLA